MNFTQLWLPSTFNAPPGAGKDYLTNRLHDQNPGMFSRQKMARIVKERTHAHYGMPGLPWDAYEGPIKDEPRPDFGGLTPRQAYIHYSENIVKPVHGERYFGECLADDLDAVDPGLIVTASDSGFAAEAMPLVEKYGKDSILLFRIRREGRDFSGDSRSYIDFQGVETHDIENVTGQAEGTLEFILSVIGKKLEANEQVFRAGAVCEDENRARPAL